MRAAWYERQGAARDVLIVGEMPDPVPGPAEVRVRITHSGINPSDVKTRAGLRGGDLPFPRIVPHNDGAGIVDAVGDGVSASLLGERVWLWNTAWGRPFGTAAEYVTVPAENAVQMPESIDGAIGACLGVPALTAQHSVAWRDGVENRYVFVAGGAGAVGHYAIQLAKLNGAAKVIATVSGPEKAAAATEAGADLVLNYYHDDIVDACADATGGAGIDRVIDVDVAANIETDLAVLSPFGEIVAYGSGSREVSVPFIPAAMRGVSLYFFVVYNLQGAARDSGIHEIERLIADDALSHRIAQTLPLDSIAEAHELVESGGADGKVLLEFRD